MPYSKISVKQYELFFGSEAQENVVRLEQEVAVVRGREEALKGVIERMIERYGAWIAHERRTEQLTGAVNTLFTAVLLVLYHSVLISHT